MATQCVCPGVFSLCLFCLGGTELFHSISLISLIRLGNVSVSFSLNIVYDLFSLYCPSIASITCMLDLFSMFHVAFMVFFNLFSNLLSEICLLSYLPVHLVFLLLYLICGSTALLSSEFQLLYFQF